MHYVDKTLGATALNLLMFLLPQVCEINHWLCNLPSQTFVKEWVIHCMAVWKCTRCHCR